MKKILLGLLLEAAASYAVLDIHAAHGGRAGRHVAEIKRFRCRIHAHFAFACDDVHFRAVFVGVQHDVEDHEEDNQKNDSEDFLPPRNGPSRNFFQNVVHIF